MKTLLWPPGQNI